MKKLLLLAALPLSTAFAQNPAGKKVFVGVSFSPDYNYRTLSAKNNTSANQAIINSRNKQEIPNFGFSTGLQAGLRLSSKLELEANMLYSIKGFRTKERELTLGNPLNPTIMKVATQTRYRTLDIPVKVNYTIAQKGRFRYFAGAGVALNLLMQTVSIADQELTGSSRQRHTDKSKQSGFSISPMLSLGARYQLKSNLCLSIEPIFRYGVLPFKDAPISETLWNAGLNFSARYYL